MPICLRIYGSLAPSSHPAFPTTSGSECIGKYLIAFSNVRTDHHIVNLSDVFAVFEQHETVIVDAADWVLPEVDREEFLTLLNELLHTLKLFYLVALQVQQEQLPQLHSQTFDYVVSCR